MNIKMTTLFSFVVFSFSMLMVQTAQAQCNTELYVNRSMRQLATGFQFSKSYRIDGRGGSLKKIEYTCVFSKETNYQIRISGQDRNAHGIIGTLYDSRRKKLASSYYNNKFLKGFTYKCNSTGIYYLSFTFKSSQSFCGSAVLGYKR